MGLTAPVKYLKMASKKYESKEAGRCLSRISGRASGRNRSYVLEPSLREYARVDVSW